LIRRRSSTLPVDPSQESCSMKDEYGDSSTAKKRILEHHDSWLRPPAIRRLRSSSSFFSSILDEDGIESRMLDDNYTTVPSFNVLATLATWFQGATTDFCKNGLPWEGSICRSKRAGLSGILYALPALVAFGHPFDQIMWSLQALLSILADYVYICQDSFWHGVDRYFAIFNLLSILARASGSLHWSVGLLSIIPLSCYVNANKAKTLNDVNAWHFWHCLWHVTVGPVTTLAMYMLHHDA